MNELQEHLLDMMKWLHTFCVENDIKYFANGGTALGAVRHNGFIPWDDDIDIMLPREDYEKLISLLSGKIVQKYTVETPYSPAKDYLYTYSKLYDTTTTLLEDVSVGLCRGIYIDIFPLDGMGDSMEEVKCNFKKVDRLNMFINSRTCNWRKGRKLYKNLAIVFAKLIPDFLVDNKKLVQKFDKIAKEIPYSSSKYVVNCSGDFRFKGIIDKSILGEPVEHVFEDTKIFVPQNAVGYLEKVFGDWKRLPDEDKRCTTHANLFIDYNKSYLEKNEK